MKDRYERLVAKAEKLERHALKCLRTGKAKKTVRCLIRSDRLRTKAGNILMDEVLGLF